MNKRRNPIATAVLIAAVATGFPAVATGAAAGGQKELQELKRQVSQLRAEIQALQVVLGEAAELDRQRNAKLTRALKDDPSMSQSEAPPAAAPPAERLSVADEAAAPPAAPAALSAPADDKGKGPARHRRHKRAARTRAK